MKALRSISSQFIAYAAAGAVGTAAHYAVLLISVNMFFVHPVTASIQGFLTGAIINYLLNYYLVFRSNRRHAEAAIKFLTITGIGLILNVIIMHVLVTLAGIYYLLAQIMATGILLLWNFAGHRLWAFADEH